MTTIQTAATVRFLLDARACPADASAYQRIVLWCSTERIPTRSRRARALERDEGAGFDVTYWQPDEDGRCNARPETRPYAAWPASAT